MRKKFKCLTESNSYNVIKTKVSQEDISYWNGDLYGGRLDEIKTIFEMQIMTNLPHIATTMPPLLLHCV